MPRTSYDQFEMLITFMEEHGDLSKPAKTPKGKLTSLNKWEELANLLNSSSSGETRTAEKWKKVWSDFKNNAKKKAGRLHKAAGGTGGGPALLSKLSDLESRALAIIGVEAATGLPVPEAGFSQQIEIPMEAEVSQVQESRDPAPPESESVLVDYDIELWNQPGPSNRPHIAPPPEPPIATSPPFLNVTQDLHRVAPSPPARHNMSPPLNRLQFSPSREGHTAAAGTPRRTSPRRRARGERRRQLQPTQTSMAAEHFLRSDAEWRQLRFQQHEDDLAMRREHNRIREMEIETQREWQSCALRLINLLEKVVDKFVNER